MLKWLMHKGIAAFERKWQYDASYLHELIAAARENIQAARGLMSMSSCR